MKREEAEDERDEFRKDQMKEEEKIEKIEKIEREEEERSEHDEFRKDQMKGEEKREKIEKIEKIKEAEEERSEHDDFRKDQTKERERERKESSDASDKERSETNNTNQQQVFRSTNQQQVFRSTPREVHPHTLYEADVKTLQGRQPVSIFLDYGSGSSWVSETLVKKLGGAYKSERQVILSGVGGSGPSITQDAQVSFRFRVADDEWTEWLKVVCGVVPKGTLPGDICLGSQCFRDYHISFTPSETVLAGLPGKPRLRPLSQTTIFSAIEMSIKQTYIDRFRSFYPEIFSPTGTSTARSRSHVQHHIETGDFPPLKIPPRRHSPLQLASLREFVESGLKQGIIRPSSSPWSSPCVLIPKKDGRWRVCVDFCSLNSKTRKNAFPLPHTQDQIQKAAGHRFYTTLDLKDGFWQVPMSATSIEKTAFSTPKGHYEFLVMPFGLTNAPATFQSLIAEVLAPHRDYTAGLLDDICIFSDDLETHVRHVQAVLGSLNDYGLVLQQKKCHWFEDSVVFLGFIINKHGQRTDPAKVAAIKERADPTNITEIRSFLNAAGYFRHFIKDFSAIASPLYDLTKNSPKPGSPITMKKEHFEAITLIKAALTSAPVLKPFDYRLPIVIDTDASGTCLGAVLLQPHPSLNSGTKTALHPVAYDSHKLTPTQSRYSAQEREMLAIVHALQTWKYWVEGSPSIVVRTDHESLASVRSKPDLPGRMLRFLDIVEHFGPKIFYRKGSTNVVPDWLSRPRLVQHSFPVDESSEDEEGEEEEGQTEVAEVKAVKSLSWIEVQTIADYLLTSTPIDEDVFPSLSTNWIKKHFTVFEDKLFRRIKSTLFEVLSEQDLMIKAEELHKVNGHSSVGALFEKVAKEYWHPESLLICQEVVRTCPQCQLRKPPRSTPSTLQPIKPVPPFHRWGIDFTGPLQTGSYKYLLNAIDYCTGWGESLPCPEQTASYVIKLLDQIRLSYGCPLELVSDNGAQFTSEVVTKYLKKHKIRHVKTTPYHPETNGKCEKFNGQIKAILWALTNEQSKADWKDYLPRALYLYRTRTQSHGFSPYYLVYGINPPAPADVEDVAYVREYTPDEDSSNAQWLIGLQEDRGDRRKWVNSAKAIRDATRSFLQEDKAEIRRWTIGDWVLRVRARNHKFEPYYDGPFQITKAARNNTYQLTTIAGTPLQGSYNGDKLFPAYVSDKQPVDSLWYGSKRLLDLDRERLARAAGYPDRPRPPIRRADYGKKRTPQPAPVRVQIPDPKPFRRHRRISRLH